MAEGVAGRPWRLPMVARNTAEVDRAATPLELLFDLCFVVAVAQASNRLHHAVADGGAGSAVVSYVLVFFAIWWAWMNFTWFSSAYDNDDVPYRLLTFVQIVGVLILAAGVPRAFDHRDFDVVFVGYLVMRIGLVSLWLRAARHDPPRRATAIRYAVGISLCMLLWGVILLVGWPVWAFVVGAAVELTVPMVAERAAPTSWHPHHIAERYGLFTLIVLGESVLAATVAFQHAIDERDTNVTLYLTAAAGLVTVFGMWWLYFAKPAQWFLTSLRVAFVWGYGHYFVFASAAAVGAGIAVNVDRATRHAPISNAYAGAAVTIPVAVYLVTLWYLQVRPNTAGRTPTALHLLAAALVLASTFAPRSVVVTALIVAALVATMVWRHTRAASHTT
jgi:low temperature requirement protein LtrA